MWTLPLHALCESLLFPVSHHPPDTAEEDGEDEEIFEAEFRQYKRVYYMSKMNVEVVSE